MLFSTSGLKRRCKSSECFRNLQTQTEIKSQKDEKNTGLNERSPSLWRSLTGREEGWRLIGSEQAENVLNYYKKRWVSNNTEKPAESTADGIDADRLTERKSLYTMWATRGLRSKDAEPRRPLKSSNDFVVSPIHDPFRHQTERMMSFMTRSYNSTEAKERCLERLRRPVSAPVFWEMDNPPLDLLANDKHDPKVTTTKKNQPRRSRASQKAAQKAAHEPAESDEDSEDESCIENKENKESVVKCFNRHEKSRNKPGDIPHLRKKYAFGGRLCANNADS